MKAIEFKRWVKDKRCLLGIWRVELNQKSSAKFTMGCYFNDVTNKYIVYLNEAVEKHLIYFESENEDEAYAELHSLVLSELCNMQELG